MITILLTAAAPLTWQDVAAIAIYAIVMIIALSRL